MADEENERRNRMFLKKSPKVLIIGAGIAGISAADCLARAGIDDFKILEATNRTGGRIWTIHIDGVNGQSIKAELGANWIHGIEQNPIYKLADENNLITMRYQGRKLGQKIQFAREDGKALNSKIVEEVDWSYGMLMQQAEEFYQMRIPTPYENDSVGAFLERGFEEKMTKYHGEDLKVRQMIFDQRLCTESVISGCDTMNDVSLSEIGSYEELPGIHYVIPKGFEQVVELLKDNLTEDKILLNHPVKQVLWNQAIKNEDHCNICVECENGKRYFADYVITTVSLGCLKAYGQRFFNPPLSTDKTDVINRLDMGTVDKVILQFDQAILEKDVFRLEVLWDKSNIEFEDMKTRWMKKIYAFECISPNVLVAWLSGKDAEYMEKLTDDEVAQSCVEVLRKFLKRSNIPMPKKCVKTSWHTNPYTYGSYSFIPVGAFVEDIETLAEPLPSVEEPQLLFAGEATHPTFYSSTHGALLTGQREAQRIIDICSDSR